MKPLSVCAFCIALISNCAAFAQGPLAPSGTPGPTMKTLDQLDAKLEKRTPISAVPFTISASGSYYVTQNLHFTATNGTSAIMITASNVTVDLNGFTLSSAAGVTGDAIRINEGLRNIAVKNGAITGTTAVTATGNPRVWTVTQGGFVYGIGAHGATPAQNGRYVDLRVSGCRNDGVRAGENSIVEGVTATQNGHTGISGANGTIIGCVSRLNGDDGIRAWSGTVTNSTANDNGGVGLGATTVTNSTAHSNETDGVAASTAHGSTSSGNGGRGFNAQSVTNSDATSNKGSGIFVFSGTVTNCRAMFNGNHGIDAQNGVVAFCYALSNNANNNGSQNINGAGATRTGNNPTP